MNRFSLVLFAKAFRSSSALRSSIFIIGLGSGLLGLNEYLLRIRFTSIWPVVSYIIYWLVMGMTFALLVSHPWRRLSGDFERLAAKAFLTGLVAGGMIAGYKAFAYQELWTVFNLLAEPLRSALFAVVVTWAVERHLRPVSDVSAVST